MVCVVIVAGVFGFLGVQTFRALMAVVPSSEVVNKQVYPKAEMPEEIVYTRPQNGMRLSEFSETCPVTGYLRGDSIDTLEGSAHVVVTIRREYTAKRANNDCWGSFTFIDWKLISIYQGTP